MYFWNLLMSLALTSLLLMDNTGATDWTSVTCKQTADVIFVVDTSSSIWPPHFNKNIKQFIKAIIGNFNVGPGANDSRIGLVVFSTRVYKEFYLKDYSSTEAIEDHINKKMRYRGGGTYTHRALDYVANTMLSDDNGVRDNVASLVIVITDGVSAFPAKTRLATDRLKMTKDVEVFAIGVGPRVRQKELEYIASKPHQDFVFHVKSFTTFGEIEDRFVNQTCRALKAAAMTTTTTTTTTTTPTTTTTTPTTTTTTTPTTTTPTTTTTTTPTTTTPTTTTTTTPTTTTPTTTTTTTPTTTTTTPTTTTTTTPTTTTTTTPTTTTTTPTTTTTTTPTTTTTTTPTTTTTTPTTTTTTTPTTTTTTPTTSTTTTPTTTTTTPTTTTTTTPTTTTTTTPTTTITTHTTTTTTTPTTTTTTTSTTTTPTTITATTTNTTTATNMILNTTTHYPTTTNTTTPKQRPPTDERPLRDEAMPEACIGRPADIYFLLDSSSSVWIGHFHHRVLPFVRDLVTSFEISPMKTRVGLVTFSDEVEHVFNLTTHQNLKSLLQGLHPSRVTHLSGGTNTGDAISYVTKRGFGGGIHREGVAKIVITVTDGRSQSPWRTAEAAQQARQLGVLMFAIGVGKHVDMSELSSIASDPNEAFVFAVESFSALPTITKRLARRTCGAVVGKMAADDGSLYDYDQKLDCSSQTLNTMFVYDSTQSLTKTKQILDHVISPFANHLAIHAPLAKMGVMTQPCIGDVINNMAVKEFMTVLEETRATHHDVTMAKLVRKVRLESFGSEQFEKEMKIAVLVLDTQTQNTANSLRKEARRLKFQGVRVLAIVVGKVDEKLLESVVSHPMKNHVIRVDSYDLLENSKPEVDLFKMICRHQPNPVLFKMDARKKFSRRGEIVFRRKSGVH